MAAGAAPRESHPSGGLPEPYSLPVTPGRLRRLHARTMTIREYHYALCVSLPASCHACFTVGMLVARFFQSFPFLRMKKRSWRIPRPARRREDVSVCRILHRNYPPGFLCQGTQILRPNAGARKGREPCPVYLGRQYCKACHDAVDQLSFQSETHIFIDVQVCISVYRIDLTQFSTFLGKSLPRCDKGNIQSYSLPGLCALLPMKMFPLHRSRALPVCKG